MTLLNETHTHKQPPFFLILSVTMSNLKEVGRGMSTLANLITEANETSSCRSLYMLQAITSYGVGEAAWGVDEQVRESTLYACRLHLISKMASYVDRVRVLD